MQFTMKQQVGKKWEEVDLTPMVGITMECLLLNYVEHPAAVAEFILDDGKKVYLCSTEGWVEFYQDRGDKAALIEPGVKALSITHREFLNVKLAPICGTAKEVFGHGVTMVSDGKSPKLDVGVNSKNGGRRLAQPGGRVFGGKRRV